MEAQSGFRVLRAIGIALQAITIKKPVERHRRHSQLKLLELNETSDCNVVGYVATSSEMISSLAWMLHLVWGSMSMSHIIME